jgi:hypothetical protein
VTHDLGSWDPLGVGEATRLFAGAPFRWWVTGGHALELHLGTSWRRHADLDIGIRRSDAVLLHGWLAGWDLQIGADGRLTPWQGEPLSASRNQNNIWCRPVQTDDWQLDVVVGAGTDERWIYRRDEAIARPWDDALLQTADGVPYLAPELQLLFKSKGLRPKDHVDARHVIPRLDPARRRSLVALLPRTHPWQRLLA